MKNTFSANEIVAVLQGEGYRALYEHDGIDTAYISSGSQGNFWEINIGDTQDDEHLFTITSEEAIEILNTPKKPRRAPGKKSTTTKRKK